MTGETETWVSLGKAALRGRKGSQSLPNGGSGGAQRHGSKVGGGMGRVDSSGANWNFEIKGCLKLSPSWSLFSQNVLLSFLRVSLSHQGRISISLSLGRGVGLSSGVGESQ